MLIWTTRFSRKKAGIGLLVLILAVAAALILGKTAPGTDPQEQPLLATNEDRVAYLESLGWEVNPEPVETLQFICRIPWRNPTSATTSCSWPRALISPNTRESR